MASAASSGAAETNQFRRMWGLGYTRLVPILPPDAEVSELSNIHRRIVAGDDARGKVPGVRGRDGLWRGLDLNAMEARETDLDLWHEMGAGVGVKTGDGLIAIDIDTTDKTAARALYELAAQHLGPAPARFGRHPKVLMPYRIEGEDPPYRGVRFSTETEDKARVEMLSAGRQFVAQGIHPATNRPYSWPQGITPLAGLTTVTHEQLDTFFRAVAENTQGVEDVEGGRRHDIRQETLRGDTDLVREAVHNLPNDNDTFPSRYDYIRAGCAIKAAFGQENEREALDAYQDWCAKWQGPNGERNDPEIVAQDWARMKPPFEIGAQWLYDHAEKFGNWQGAHKQFFQPIEGAETPQAQNDARSGGFNLLTIDDVIHLPPPKFLIDRYVPEQGFGILFGDPGCGKSFIALDMAMHIAYGLGQWHGDAIDTTKGTGVLYIAGEGASGFRARVRAWQAKNLTPETAHGKPNLRFLFDPMSFMRTEDVGRLAQTVRDANFTGIRLIIVDTVSRAIPGADENLQKDMTTFVAACDALRHMTGAFVLGVHHTSKQGDMRGSSVFRGQADVVLRMERKKGRAIGRVSCDKQKDAPDGWSDAYRLETIKAPTGEESLVPVRVGNDEVAAEEGVVTADDNERIKQAIAEAWASGRPLSDKPQAGARYAPRALHLVLDMKAGMIEQAIGLMLQTGEIAMSIHDAHSKKKGLCVVPTDGADESDGTESSGASAFD